MEVVELVVLVVDMGTEAVPQEARVVHSEVGGLLGEPEVALVATVAMAGPVEGWEAKVATEVALEAEAVPEEQVAVVATVVMAGPVEGWEAKVATEVAMVARVVSEEAAAGRSSAPPSRCHSRHTPSNNRRTTNCNCP